MVNESRIKEVDRNRQKLLGSFTSGQTVLSLHATKTGDYVYGVYLAHTKDSIDVLVCGNRLRIELANLASFVPYSPADIASALNEVRMGNLPEDRAQALESMAPQSI